MAATAGPVVLTPSMGSDPQIVLWEIGSTPSRRHCLYSPERHMLLQKVESNTYRKAFTSLIELVNTEYSMSLGIQHRHYKL